MLTLASDCIKKKDIPNGGAEPLLRDTQKFGRLLQAMVDDLLHHGYRIEKLDRLHAPAGVVHP